MIHPPSSYVEGEGGSTGGVVDEMGGVKRDRAGEMILMVMRDLATKKKLINILIYPNISNSNTHLFAHTRQPRNFIL